MFVYKGNKYYPISSGYKLKNYNLQEQFWEKFDKDFMVQ